MPNEIHESTDDSAFITIWRHKTINLLVYKDPISLNEDVNYKNKLSKV